MRSRRRRMRPVRRSSRQNAACMRKREPGLMHITMTIMTTSAETCTNISSHDMLLTFRTWDLLRFPVKPWVTRPITEPHSALMFGSHVLLTRLVTITCTTPETARLEKH